MPLPTCQCNAGLPIQQQLGNIYCALVDVVNGGGGTGGTPISDLPVATEMQPDDVTVGNVSDVTSQIPKNVMLTLRTDLVADGEWDGIALEGTSAGENISVGDAVKIGAGSWILTDAESGGIFPAAGICVKAALNGAIPIIMVQGVLRSNAHGFTGTLYLSAGTSGTLTSTPPAGSGDCVQSVGFVIDSNILYLNFTGEYVTLT